MDNRLTGYIIIGDVTGAGVYTRLVREKTDLKDLDTDKLKESATLAMFMPDARHKMLGGAV